MTLIAQSIRNFIAGISQQPNVLRHPEQLEEQLNGFSTEANGLQKRPPTQMLFKLPTKSLLDIHPLVHKINRDANEKYFVIFTGADIEVYDVQTGEKKEVKFEGKAKEYITTASPRSTIKCATVADYTFLTNLGVKTRMSSKHSPAVWNTQGALINVKSGQYGRTYQIVVNGKQIASHTTPDGSDRADSKLIATDAIASALATQCISNGYAVQQGSSWLYVYSGDGGTAEVKTKVYPIRTPQGECDYLRAITSDAGLSTKEVWIGANAFTFSVFPPFADTVAKVIEQATKDGYVRVTDDPNVGVKEICFRQTVQEVTTTVPLDKGVITSCQVYDGFNNQAMFSIMQRTQKFTNLPASAPNGFVCEIAGEEGSASDDYYVMYNETSGIWEETVRPNVPISFDGDTMPHVLVRGADGTFTCRSAEWEDRKVGDDNSNPQPSFIDLPINDVFFYRNRLGFIAGENTILTASSDFFNFWMASAVEVQDTDPIDNAVSSNTVATLYNAIPFNSDCLLFGQDTQFALKANGVLSPKDALLDTLTNFRCSIKTKPVGAGRNIYYPVERAEYSSINEYYTAQDNTGEKDAQDITAHVPNYIPNGIYSMIGSTVENMVLLLTEGEPDAMFVYKYLFINGVRQQAAWSKWKFNGDILGATFIDSYLYMLIKREDTVYMERMSFAVNTTEYHDEPYRLLLDSKIEYTIPESAYDSVTDTTTVDVLPLYGLTTNNGGYSYCAVTHDGQYVIASDNKVTRLGNLSGQKIYIGIQYTFKVVLSELMIKKKDTAGNTTSITDGNLMLQYLWLQYSSSGFFDVLVKHTKNGVTYEYKNTVNKFGDTFGSIEFTTGEFKIPLQTKSTNCVVSIVSDAPNPVALLGARWQGNYTTRTKRLW